MIIKIENNVKKCIYFHFFIKPNRSDCQQKKYMKKIASVKWKKKYEKMANAIRIFSSDSSNKFNASPWTKIRYKLTILVEHTDVCPLLKKTGKSTDLFSNLSSAIYILHSRKFLFTRFLFSYLNLKGNRVSRIEQFVNRSLYKRISLNRVECVCVCQKDTILHFSIDPKDSGW